MLKVGWNMSCSYGVLGQKAEKEKKKKKWHKHSILAEESANIQSQDLTQLPFWLFHHGDKTGV